MSAEDIKRQIEEIGNRMQTATADEKRALAKKWISLNNRLLMGIDGPRTIDGEGVDRTPRGHGR